ncbi:hypothetical protein EOPP23_02030 [Endozoicomonas sp. OPT23]|uniref:hypothetical protein n=1 Tax=Endozoicomonas sp. OPT23 TaxID=2072845 RepID=UPI00129B5891|nr:hypothetical protein [Endozoicomonas sp. OPT23]MRI31774.1 hypothetical protein [Endozoicomonas sp. OPT23]
MKGQLFLLLCAIWLMTWWQKDQLPAQLPHIPELRNEPVQEKVDLDPFLASVANENYSIFPKYHYELWGLVVSVHHSDVWWDRMHKRASDYLNIKDICVVWGDQNTLPEFYRNVEFSSGQWTCYYSTRDMQAHNLFQGDRFANNHILADDPFIAEQIMASEIGDIIHFKGYLSDYKGRLTQRQTSTTRTDTGNGACETVYITDFNLLHRSNAGWKKVHLLSGWIISLWVMIALTIFFWPIVQEFAGAPSKRGRLRE